MRKLSYMVLISIITSLSLLATDRILTSGGKVVAYNGKPVISKDYTPTDADNVVAWYDANDTNTITELAGAVSGWADKSGNTNDAVQSTGADQPSTGTHTINGLNTIEFNDDYLQNTTSLTNVRAIFFVSDIIEGAGSIYQGCACYWRGFQFTRVIYLLELTKQIIPFLSMGIWVRQVRRVSVAESLWQVEILILACR